MSALSHRILGAETLSLRLTNAWIRRHSFGHSCLLDPRGSLPVGRLDDHQFMSRSTFRHVHRSADDILFRGWFFLVLVVLVRQNPSYTGGSVNAYTSAAGQGSQLWEAVGSWPMWDWRGRLKIGAYTAELGKHHDRPGLEEVPYPITQKGERVMLVSHDAAVLIEHLTRGSLLCCTTAGSCAGQILCSVSSHCRPASTISFDYLPYLPYLPRALNTGVETFPFFHAQVGPRRHTSDARWNSRSLWRCQELYMAAESWGEGSCCGRTGVKDRIISS